MAALIIGIYRKWLGPVPEDSKGKQLPKSLWPQKRRHNWLVRWVGTTGKKYGKVFKTKKEAQLFGLETQSKLLAGKADKHRKITLHDFRLEHEKIIKGQVSYGTYQEHKKTLELFENFIGGSIELSRITPSNAEAFIADRLDSKELSIATVNKYFRNLKSIFNRAIEPRGYLSQGQNPFAKIKPRKTTVNAKRYVNIKEYCALLETTEELWWKRFIAIAYSSGLRKNEILHLTWKDIDFDRKRINVVAKKNRDRTIEWEPKSRKNRVVPISNEAINLLVNIHNNAPDQSPYIFISPQRLERILERIRIGKWNDRSDVINNVTRKFAIIREKAKVEKCTIHDLRRSAITNWAEKLPFQVVHKLAGHSHIKTTMDYYLIVRPEDFSAASKVFDEMLAKAKLD